MSSCRLPQDKASDAVCCVIIRWPFLCVLCCDFDVLSHNREATIFGGAANKIADKGDYVSCQPIIVSSFPCTPYFSPPRKWSASFLSAFYVSLKWDTLVLQMQSLQWLLFSIHIKMLSIFIFIFFYYPDEKVWLLLVICSNQT